MVFPHGGATKIWRDGRVDGNTPFAAYDPYRATVRDWGRTLESRIDEHGRQYKNLSSLLQDPVDWPAGQKLVTEAGHSYRVAEPGETPHFVTEIGRGLLAIPAPSGRVSQKAFGALGDGVTDDTAACQAAHNSGMSIEDEGTFLVSNLTAKVSVRGGTYLRKAGSGGDFIVTGAPAITLDCSIDGADQSGNNFVIRHDGVIVTSNVIIRNARVNGIRHENGDNVEIYAQILNARQTHLVTSVSDSDINGLVIDVLVDGVGLGLGNINGGVKVHGNAQFAVVKPKITAVVKLLEHEDMHPNSVCIETFGNVISPTITGSVKGGSIGCTMNNSPNGVASVQARGQNNLGLEITDLSHGARFIEGSVAEAGDVVAPNYCCQASNTDYVEFNVRMDSPTHLRESTSANVYINMCNEVRISGYANRTGGSQFVRIRGSDNIELNALRCNGTGVQRAILMEQSGVTSNNLLIKGCNFVGVTNFMQAVGSFSGMKCTGSRVENTGLLIAGSPSLNGYQFHSGTEIALHPFGSRGDIINVLDFAPAASLIEAWGAGAPEGYVKARVGSDYYDTSGGAGSTKYVKESGTGSTGWTAK